MIYSAFDVVALYRCYPNFPKVSISQYRQPNTEQFDVKLKLASYAVSLKKIKKKNLANPKKVDSFWDENSDLLINLINVKFDILKFTVLDCVSTIGNNLLCIFCQSYSNCSFIKFLDHCKQNHFNENSPKDDKIGIKKLFMIYLNSTGRINIDDLCCIMCDNKGFDSENELCQHCWNDHSKEVIEFLPRPKKKKGKKGTKEDENNNDDDDDNESGNEDKNDKDNDDNDDDDKDSDNDNDKDSDDNNDEINDDESNSSYDENDNDDDDD